MNDRPRLRLELWQTFVFGGPFVYRLRNLTLAKLILQFHQKQNRCAKTTGNDNYVFSSWKELCDMNNYKFASMRREIEFSFLDNTRLIQTLYISKKFSKPYNEFYSIKEYSIKNINLANYKIDRAYIYIYILKWNGWYKKDESFSSLFEQH